MLEFPVSEGAVHATVNTASPALTLSMAGAAGVPVCASAFPRAKAKVNSKTPARVDRILAIRCIAAIRLVTPRP